MEAATSPMQAQTKMNTWHAQVEKQPTQKAKCIKLHVLKNIKHKHFKFSFENGFELYIEISLAPRDINHPKHWSVSVSGERIQRRLGRPNHALAVVGSRLRIEALI